MGSPQETWDAWTRSRQSAATIARNKARGLTFVNLFASAKQLVDNFPKRFPYLEYHVRSVEEQGLAPLLESER